MTDKTEWNQNTGYNEVINAVRVGAGLDGGYPAGCVAVAIAQVLAYHEWPAVCSLPGFLPVSVSLYAGEPIKFSDMFYNWTAMKAVPKAIAGKGMSVNGRLGVNVFLHEVAQNVETTYSIKDSEKVGSAFRDNIRGAFQKMGYAISSSGLSDYYFSSIRQSIDKRLPVIVVGNSLEVTTTWTNYYWFDLFEWFPQYRTATGYQGGHAWVVDDYDFAVVEVPTEYGKFPQVEPMVHCNLGWGGDRNGWYKSGVFDTNDEDIDDAPRSVGGAQRSSVPEIKGEERYYRYKLQMIPYLKPNRK